MATSNLDTFATKIANVFKKDLYVYKYQYCVGGPSSEVENEGKFVCILDPVYSQALKEMYPNKECIYFSDIKKSKKEPETYISFYNDEFTLAKIKKHIDAVMSKHDNDSLKWEVLNLSEDDVNDIFYERNLHPIFKDRDDIATFHLAKSEFPLLSEKNALNTTISFKYLGEDDNNISSIIFSYSTDWFVVIEYLMYIEID